ncbi:MAG TPA: hypothetical protein VFU63_14730, partial [Ktedonobacterales bacterium]|nr:hypothetical protein [Ktedonobacterales bacterium]
MATDNARHGGYTIGGVRWEDGATYESYIGRWSRLVAREFVTWLNVPPHADWIDVGCGTGPLTQAILEQATPARIRG